MPELPEVERARRDLSRWMEGAKVTRAWAWDRVVVRGALARAIAGQGVRAVGRRGKWLRLELDGCLVFAHLGMTGDFVVRRPEDAPLRWERARIDVARGGKIKSVRYRDPRRFGRIVVARADTPEWRALGPDPLLDGIDLDRLEGLAQARRAPIKVTVMDQKVLAGVGNILANEALFLARVDPRAPSRSLGRAEMRAIARAVRAVIARGLRGPNARLFVYGRAGEPCRRCGTRLSGAVIAGRTTTFCPRCQR